MTILIIAGAFALFAPAIIKLVRDLIWVYS